ncbi:K(+)-transporting ATPase subunit F [Streptomyces sp. SID9727]
MAAALLGYLFLALLFPERF